MNVADRNTAQNALRRIGYYRLSGYWYPFRVTPKAGDKPTSDFIQGTEFDEALRFYAFDERLRTALFECIAQVEVALRFELGHRLGKHGPFAHLDEAHFDPGFIASHRRGCNRLGCGESCQREESDHEEWLDRQRNTESVSTEAFAAHFRENYGEPLPIWVATEVMSFGKLTKLLDGLESTERELLAADWDILDQAGQGDASVLSNWMEHLRQVRNVCAHHARVWNRNINAIIAIPAGVEELQHLAAGTSQPKGDNPLSLRRVYGTFAILTHLLAVIDVPEYYRQRLRQVLTEFLIEHPSSRTNMGFPRGWDNELIAAEQYQRNQQRYHRASLLRSVPTAGGRDCAELLTIASNYKQQRSKLNYYRKNGALLSVQWSARHMYPLFQFDQETGDVPDLVIRANRRLLDGGTESENLRWQAMEWWSTPNLLVPNGLAPAEALKLGQLTSDALDLVLAPRSDE